MAMDSFKKDVARVEGEVVELLIVSVVARVVVTPVAWSPGQFLSRRRKSLQCSHQLSEVWSGYQMLCTTASCSLYLPVEVILGWFQP